MPGGRMHLGGGGLLHEFVASSDDIEVSVASLTALGNLSTTGRASGSRAFVVSVGDTYVFSSTCTHTPDGVVVTAGKNGGCWVSRLYGRWDEVIGDVSLGQAVAALTYEAFRNTAYLMYFMRHDQDDTLHFRFQLSHRFDTARAVVAHVHILPMADPVSPQNILFDGYYAWSTMNAPALPALAGWTTFSVPHTVNPGDVYIHKYVKLAEAVPPASARDSSFLLVYLRRNGTGLGDTYTTGKDHGTAAANVGVLMADVHYRLNEHGSVTELPA